MERHQVTQCGSCEDGHAVINGYDDACPYCHGTGWFGPNGSVDPDETMVDLGGGMVVPLREVLDDELDEPEAGA